jgi:hypothetical protein
MQAFAWFVPPHAVSADAAATAEQLAPRLMRSLADRVRTLVPGAARHARSAAAASAAAADRRPVVAVTDGGELRLLTMVRMSASASNPACRMQRLCVHIVAHLFTLPTVRSSTGCCEGLVSRR